MSELPKGWALAKLSELIVSDGLFIDGDWVESKDQDPNGDVRLIQLADIGDGFFINKSNRHLTYERALSLNCTFLQKNDVLIARMPDPLGRACIYPLDSDKKAVTVVDVCIIRSSKEYINHIWLAYFINAPKFREEISYLQSGSTRKRISRGNLATLDLPIPPLNEQTRIVSKLEELLSELDAGVNELKTAQAKLIQYRQSLLKAAVEGELTREWRAKNSLTPTPLPEGDGLKFPPTFGGRVGVEGNPHETGAQLLERILLERRKRWEAKQLAKFAEQGKQPPKDWQKKYPEPVQPDTTDLPELPEGWVWASLDMLAFQIRNGVSPKPNTDKKGYPILRISAVRSMSVNLSEIRHLELNEIEAKDFLIKNNDILITRYNGSIDLLGVFGVVRNLLEPTLHPDKLIRVQTVLDQPLADWIEISANNHHSRRYVVSKTKTTSGQTGVSGEDIKKTPIPLPSLVEQKRVSQLVHEELEIIKNQSAAIEQSLKQSAAQRKNILRAAFAGELVPQDPNDEPASVLLERIQAERAAQTAAKKPRSRKKTPNKNGACHEN